MSLTRNLQIRIRHPIKPIEWGKSFRTQNTIWLDYKCLSIVSSWLWMKMNYNLIAISSLQRPVFLFFLTKKYKDRRRTRVMFFARLFYRTWQAMHIDNTIKKFLAVQEDHYSEGSRALGRMRLIGFFSENTLHLSFSQWFILEIVLIVSIGNWEKITQFL